MNVVYFSAPWCAPCKSLLPKVRETVEAAGGTLDVVNIDDPDGAACAAAAGVLNVPTIVLPDGAVVGGTSKPWPALRAQLNAVLA